MANIPSRTPYYVGRTVEILQVLIKVYKKGTAEPIDWQYTLVKNSYKQGVQEYLRVNISPFINDFYSFTHDSVPTAVQSPSGTMELTVKLSVNGVIETHTAFFGTAVVSSDMFVNMRSNKPIVMPGGGASPLGYISFTVANTDNIVYTTDLGVTQILPVTQDPNSLLQIAPFVPENMDVDGATSITIEALDGTTVRWSQKFTIVCMYESDESIGFINWYGAWEFFFITGARTTVFKGTGSEYLSYADGKLAQYDNNYSDEITLNTGWVDSRFRQVIESLLISTYMIYYSGGIWSYKIILVTKTIPRQSIRRDKMLNYNLVFKSAQSLVHAV